MQKNTSKMKFLRFLLPVALGSVLVVGCGGDSAPPAEETTVEVTEMAPALDSPVTALPDSLPPIDTTTDPKTPPVPNRKPPAQ
jgi:hypothetical protein